MEEIQIVRKNGKSVAFCQIEKIVCRRMAFYFKVSVVCANVNKKKIFWILEFWFLVETLYLCKRYTYVMMRIHRFTFLLASLFLSLVAVAQESGTVFNFLNLPVSSHSAALGGKNISLMEDDISLPMQNPALLSNISDKSVGFSFMTYILWILTEMSG